MGGPFALVWRCVVVPPVQSTCHPCKHAKVRQAGVPGSGLCCWASLPCLVAGGRAGACEAVGAQLGGGGEAPAAALLLSSISFKLPALPDPLTTGVPTHHP